MAFDLGNYLARIEAPFRAHHSNLRAIQPWIAPQTIRSVLSLLVFSYRTALSQADISNRIRIRGFP